MFAEWRICRVSIDYHVEVEAHYYSVPHRFVRAEVEVRFTARTVEIFHKGERIAAHQRMSGNHKHTTVPEHMASSHRRYAGWTIERIQSLVGRAGNKRPLGRSGCGSTNVVKAMAQETCTCGGA